MPEIVILGAGMAGFGAAHRMSKDEIRPVVFDRAEQIGGHAASYDHDSGFRFDDGPHVSFTKNERIQELFAEFVQGEYASVEARANNYWRGHWVKHPAICNLHGLPTELVLDCIADFVKTSNEPEPEINNYRDWLLASYGEAFYENFPKDYTVRYHTAPAERMDTDWLGPRLYRPNLREVLRGALDAQTPDVHYVQHFRYPKRGGFASYVSPFPGLADIHLRHEVVQIDTREQTVFFQSGEHAGYDHLISSLPITELLRLLDEVPSYVKEAADRLAVSTCVVVNVGVNRSDLSDAHWSYFYDPDVFFTRLSFPHMLAEDNAPPGTGSLQAECYYSGKYRPLDRTPDECIDPVIRDLLRCKILREEDEILYRGAQLVPYANVIFDLDRRSALDTVNGYLDDLGIARCGRYGEWGYHWTDESFVSGENAAERVLQRF